MGKILINLLPVELAEVAKEQKKKLRITKVSIGIIIVMILITSIVFAYRIIQSGTNEKIASNINAAREKINSYKQQEELLTVLKNRIDGITGLISKESIQAQAFNLIYALNPPQVKIVNLSIDKSGRVQMTGETTDIERLRFFFDNLTDPKKHEGKIAAVSIEGLSRASSGKIKFDLSIYLVGAGKPLSKS